MLTARSRPEHWVFVFGWLTMGGAERQGLRFAESLQKQHGARITVIGLSNPGVVEEECRRLGFECIYLRMQLRGGWLRKVRILLRFARCLRALKPTFIAPYTMLPDVLCGITWRFTGARACVWQQRDEGRFRQMRFLEWLAVKLTPRFVSNSQHACGWLVQELGVSRDKIRMVHNGILVPDVTDVVNHSWRHKSGILSEEFVASMIANIHVWKDHETLVRAWRIVVERSSPERPVRLVLAGHHASAFEKISALIAELELNRHVMLPGSIVDVPSLLASTDLVVFSSLTEGCPNAVLEGMAVGLPVAATDIPAIREAVGDAGAEYLSLPKDVEVLAECILKFYNDPKLSARQGAVNRQRIRDIFGNKRMAEETRAVFMSENV